jgi:16S rRNA (uracil1498-N3)-methyltransferase
MAFHDLALFFENNITSTSGEIVLNSDNHHYIANVLRHKVNDELRLTNGKGLEAFATITSISKKETTVAINKSTTHNNNDVEKVLVLAPIKNNSRMEWLVEKATELGLSTIQLISTQRTEKNHLRLDRLQTIMTSAMLQSNRFYSTTIAPAISFEDALDKYKTHHQYIAHCNQGSKQPLHHFGPFNNNTAVYIGPEGDFTPYEVELAVKHNITEVSLGNTKLRTETAALVAATYICQL